MGHSGADVPSVQWRTLRASTHGAPYRSGNDGSRAENADDVAEAAAHWTRPRRQPSGGRLPPSGVDGPRQFFADGPGWSSCPQVGATGIVSGRRRDISLRCNPCVDTVAATLFGPVRAPSSARVSVVSSRSSPVSLTASSS